MRSRRICYPEYLYGSGDQQNNGHNNDPVPKEVMGFFSSAISILQTLVSAIGAGLGVWGVINLLEGYGNDNLFPSFPACSVKQAGAGLPR